MQAQRASKLLPDYRYIERVKQAYLKNPNLIGAPPRWQNSILKSKRGSDATSFLKNGQIASN
jgi:hypothetical protein